MITAGANQAYMNCVLTLAHNHDDAALVRGIGVAVTPESLSSRMDMYVLPIYPVAVKRLRQGLRHFCTSASTTTVEEGNERMAQEEW